MNLNGLGRAFMLLAFIALVAMNVYFYAMRCVLSPSVDVFAVLIGLTCEAIALAVTALVLDCFAMTSLQPGKHISSAYSAQMLFVVWFGCAAYGPFTMRDALMRSDAAFAPGARSAGDACPQPAWLKIDLSSLFKK
jgi:hypothetical protein